jgi:predicted DNA-binding protein
MEKKKGRPQLTNEKLIQTTIYLRSSQKQWIEQRSMKYGTDQAKIIRKAINEYIEREGKKNE